MNIGIIGSGGREHSLCHKLLQSKFTNKIYCFPGNAGTKSIAINININSEKFDKLYSFVLKKNIELLIVGPEIPLVEGIVDYFEEKNIKVFGPSKKASRLEGSKIFMKDFCKQFLIPTAKFKKISNKIEAEKFIFNAELPVVVKSDGLAAGKGVTICNDARSAIDDVNSILSGKFKSSNKVFIEEFLEGEELSYFVLTDGENFQPLGTAQDHKKIGEGDTGLNTGGMGAYSPSKIINEELEKKIQNKIIIPTLKGMKKLGNPYKGILYAGLIIKNNEPKLIEYNVRFGDPECQVLMLRLKSDLLYLILSTFDNRLMDKKIIWKSEPAITIVGASKGYPNNYENNVEIENIKDLKLKENQFIFHAGTLEDKLGKIRTNGGRVLNSTVIADTLKDARDQAINILDSLNWKNKYYRRDIGFKYIK